MRSVFVAGVLAVVAAVLFSTNNRFNHKAAGAVAGDAPATAPDSAVLAEGQIMAVRMAAAQMVNGRRSLVVKAGPLAVDCRIAVRTRHDASFYAYFSVQDRTGKIVAQKQFPNFALQADDVVSRRHKWEFHLAPGEYRLFVGVQELTPVVDKQGKRISEENSYGRDVYPVYVE